MRQTDCRRSLITDNTANLSHDCRLSLPVVRADSSERTAMPIPVRPSSLCDGMHQKTVFVTIFAYLILKEPITVVQCITGIITIIGVFIISKPEFIFGAQQSESDHLYDNRILGIILSLISAIASAFSLISLRRLKTTPVSVIVMWYSLTVVVIGSAILPLLDSWVAPKGWHIWLLLLAIGAAGVLDQFFLTTALKYEGSGPVSVTGSFNIVLSFVWEVAIFAEPVEWNSIVGASLISGCVVVIAVHKCYKENPEKFVRFFKDISMQ